MTADSFQVKMQMFFSRHVTPPKPHQFLYRLTGGLIGSRLPGVKPGVLLLTVKGRRSGKSRTTPLVYFNIDDQIVVAGTNNGEDSHPAWYWNLKSNPQAIMQIGRLQRAVRGRIATGEERERIWASMTEVHPLFRAYQQKTSRQIPVIILEAEE